MGTVKELLAIANKQLGVTESPPNSNKVLYNDWYYNRTVSGAAYAWCMTFCQWVYNEAGVQLPTVTASCTAMLEAAKKAVCLVEENYRPGDLLLFNFEGKKTVSTHCGILTEISPDKKTYITIEGNTSIGNDINGGKVMLRSRKLSSIVGGVRPKFSGEEELDMTKEEFLKSLTDKEAFELISKAMAYAEKLPEPDWSKKEGHWSRLIKMGVINTSTPEAFIKRDEIAAILGRAGVI